MKTLLALILLSVTGIAQADKIIECAPRLVCAQTPGKCVPKGGVNMDEMTEKGSYIPGNYSLELTKITFLAASNPQCVYSTQGNTIRYVVTDWKNTEPDLEPPYGHNWHKYDGSHYACSNLQCRFKLVQENPQ